MAHDEGGEGGVDLERLTEEASAARARRHAVEAERLAALQGARARFEAEAMQLAEDRRMLDLERERRAIERQHVEAEAQRIESERRALEEVERELSEIAEERRKLEIAQAARTAARLALESEAARIVAEREVLESSERQSHAAVDAQRIREEELAAQRARVMAEQAAEIEAWQREIAAVDERLAQRERALEASREVPAPAPLPLGRLALKRKPRVRVSASILIESSGTAVALRVENVSMSGALLSTAGKQLAWLKEGDRLTMTLFSNADVDRQVDVVARIVRVQLGQVAVDWSDDAASAHSLAKLLDTLSG